ncbi:MAG TPA: tRNA lysidine(34) synthetase TilS [Vicinamibacterales bacterium]
MHSGFHQQVRRTIARHAMLPTGARVLVGLSGGSDSVGLLLVLHELAEYGGFHVVGAGHFNHRARPTADRDEGFCRDLTASLGIAFVRDDADVVAAAAAEGQSFEECARRLRYAFLHRAARDLSADHIAVGHTRDDQAETFLLKLARGAGASGLGAVYPRRGGIVRPLLDVSREEIRVWLVAQRQGWVEDESNADLGNPRNRIRHRVLPELDAAYGGPTRAQLARAADLAREDGQWLDEQAAVRLAILARRGQDCVEFDASALLMEPAPLLRRLILQAMRQQAPGREIGLEHVELGLEVLRGERRGADVPGSRWELRRQTLVLFPQDRR